ncbi:MAG: hypothetical protein ABSA92_04035 [Candidatus Bathyarchaeia archaeon]
MINENSLSKARFTVWLASAQGLTIQGYTWTAADAPIYSFQSIMVTRIIFNNTITYETYPLPIHRIVGHG